jgi:hypothetical protein
MDQSIRLRRPDEKLQEECLAMDIVFLTGSVHAIPLDLGNRRFIALDANTGATADERRDIKVVAEVR